MKQPAEVISVLVVEDDFRVAEINASFVDRVPGFRTVAKAGTGREAMQLLAAHEPDLVLLDIFLPDVQGLELLWEIRARHRKADVIMLTASTESEAVLQALRGGAADYILKPILFERLEAALERYRAQRSRLLAARHPVNQALIDQLFHRGPSAGRTAPAPKGIDPLTLEKVSALLRECGPGGVTAEDAGNRLGVSRSTARRYLEYLIGQGQAVADLAYGTVGRPERRYLHRPPTP